MSKPASSASMRRHDLDALRAFAMLLGVVFHASLPFVTTGWMVSDWKQTDLLGPFTLWVHGFRMPLFIFISGYFTQMMWRRRGLVPMVQQRFLRVFLPMVLGVFTVLPFQDRVVAWANGRAAEADARRYSTPGVRSDLVEAVRQRDATALRKLLDAGADPNQVDPEFKQPALSWASHLNNVEAARVLIEKGADVNRASIGGHRALSSAAYFGHPEILELLLRHGADPKLKNDAGEVPLESTTKPWEEVKGVAAYLRLPWSMKEEEFRLARDLCRKQLQQHAASTTPSASYASSEAKPAGLLERMRNGYRGFLASDQFRVKGTLPLLRSNPPPAWHLFFTSIFDHLWFLWFLCWLVAALVIVVKVGRILGLPAIPSAWLLTPRAWVWLMAITMVPQLWMGVFGLGFGPDTSVGLLPQPHLLLYYGIFFGMGALYFDSDDANGRLGARYPLLLSVAMLGLLPLGFITQTSVPLLSGLFQVGFAWAMTFGLIGLFRRHLSGENRTLRYLSDSAYWLYIAHHPLVALIQSILRPWDAPAMLKWLVLVVTLLSVLLLSYHVLVRNTPIGWLLNGRPKARAKT
jgi:peptidoglycan/LPS O-acetylase OafA/YrhL